jgi:hypothetical protein
MPPAETIDKESSAIQTSHRGPRVGLSIATWRALAAGWMSDPCRRRDAPGVPHLSAIHRALRRQRRFGVIWRMTIACWGLGRPPARPFSWGVEGPGRCGKVRGLPSRASAGVLRTVVRILCRPSLTGSEATWALEPPGNATTAATEPWVTSMCRLGCCSRRFAATPSLSPRATDTTAQSLVLTRRWYMQCFCHSLHPGTSGRARRM